MSEYKRSQADTSRILGVIMILLGVAFLVAQFFYIDLGRFFWPFFVIVPGVVIFLLGLTSVEGLSEVLAIIGSIVTMTGLLLLYQNTFDHFESWAYAWALVGPTSVGLGQIVYGRLKNRPGMVRSGREVTKVGLWIFGVGFVFFELILNISGFDLGGFGLAIVLIGLGVFVLVRTLRK